MISFKKSYAEQMLQLVLALSLLQVDPENYLGRSWETQLNIHNGGDHQWELEMLRAVPMTQYPYSNRKAMIPLIEDLVRFDRQTTVSNYHNITAYLLNVQNAQNNQTVTQALQQLQNHESIASTSSPSLPSSTTGNSQTTASLDHHHHHHHSLIPGNGSSITFTTNNLNLTANHEMELFLNSDHFQEQIPLIEQNLLDINEYEDLLPVTATNFDIYYGLPLKDEPPPDPNLSFDIKIENIFQNDILSTTTASSTTLSPSSSSTTTTVDHNELNVNNTKQLNNTSSNNESDNLISENLNDLLKIEENNEKIDEIQTNQNETNKKLIKTEIKDELLNDTESHHDGLLLSNEDLNEKESEIVEVLWKQDVDLGYSLSPTKSLSSSNPDGTSSNNSDDDVEKLKALEELKLEKIKDDTNKPVLDDEWAGIPFTIDNETGEYIRLPLQLDEILQDVLQLAELTSETQETKGPIPSTSTAKDTPTTTTNNQRLDSTGKSLDEGLSSATDEDDDDLDSRQSLPSPLFDFDNASDLDEEIDMMIQSAGPFHQHHRSAGQNYVGSNSAFRQSTGFHHHHHHHQARVPLSRGVSMEQRLQDIASLFNPIPGMGVSVGDMAPYSHYPNPYYQSGPPGMQHGQFGHHPVLHNASLADLGGAQPHYGHNLGSAVSSSMHLTNSSHENDSSATAYKMEHDMMYYSNTSSELNHTTDGFINSILNDEDLQLMDMGVNDSFCPMRMVDCNTTSNNSSVLGVPSSVGGASGSHHHHHHHNQHHNQLHASMQNHLRSGLGGLTSGIATGGIGGTETVVGASLGSDGMGSSGDRLDASSDSAVSSMGSERVPSLSDGEWGEGSDSAQDYHQGKYGGTNGAGVGRTAGGPHDYSYNSRLGDAARQQPVAQKKHQMFGKRYFQDQPTHLPTLPHQQSQNLPIGTQQNLDNLPGSIKYEYEPYPTGLHHSSSGLGLGSNISSMDGAVGPLIGKDNHIPSGHWSLDFAQPVRHHPRTGHELISHNHTYTLPQGTGSTPRPTLRDKKAIKKAQEDEHLTRDEKRARALNVPIPVPEIINLPMDEFNERLSKYDLTENQLSLIRDIRRRGKNKVAAQNCRKRKLDQILSLEDEVKEVRRKKEQYFSDRDMYLTEKNRISNKFAALHRHVFQYLRDPDGNLCSPTEYSLQQAADGSVYLLRRDTNKPVETNTSANNSNTQSSNYDTPSNSSHHHYHQHHHLQQQQQQQQQTQTQQQHHHHSSQRPSPSSSSSHHQKE